MSFVMSGKPLPFRKAGLVFKEMGSSLEHPSVLQTVSAFQENNCAGLQFKAVFYDGAYLPHYGPLSFCVHDKKAEACHLSAGAH